jgi:hypothetical protein
MRVKVIPVLLAAISLALPASVQAAVIAGWTNTGNVYRFHVTSDTGNITSLELSFAAAPGSTFQTEFADTVFDSDGTLAGFRDSFLLFPASVTSPGATQAKTSTLLQAAFTGFTPFASRDVAQLIVEGNLANPRPSTIDRDGRNMGKAVVETIAGNPNSRMEFPISGSQDLSPPVVTPRVINVGVLNIGDLVNVQLLATDDFNLPGELIWSNLVPNPGNPGKSPLFPQASDPSLNSAGVFNWNPTGWKPGAYLFYADVADRAEHVANQSLVLSVFYIPEPASVWLLVAGMTGFVLMRRQVGQRWRR